MSKCNECKKPFDNKSVITPCICCSKLFHGTPACAGISVAAASVMILEDGDPLLVYRCKKCTELGGISAQLLNTLQGMKDLGNKVSESCDFLKSFENDFINLKKEVEVLKSKSKKLEKENNSLKEKVSNIPSEDKMYHEFQDRYSRRNNLIMYGLTTPDPTDRINTDLLKARDCLKGINNIDLTKLSVMRIGKAVDNKPQPLLIKMASKTEVIRVLKNKKKLPKNITVSADKTASQRSQLKELWKVVDEYNRLNNGKKTVKFISDTPTIVNIDDENHQE